jgi:hypothetical protein
VEVEFQPTRISSRLQQAGLFATYQSAGTAERDAWNQLSEAISMELETDKSASAFPQMVKESMAALQLLC